MIQLNHLSLAVPHVGETRAFFERFFDFTCETVKGDNVIAVLKGAGGHTLVLTTQKTPETYPGDFHFGFIVQNQAMVDETYKRLQEGGHPMEDGPRKIRDSYGFYFHIPGDVLTEVSCPL